MIQFTRNILIFCLLIFNYLQTFLVDRASWWHRWQGKSPCRSSSQNFRYPLLGLESQCRLELSHIQDPIPVFSLGRSIPLRAMKRAAKIDIVVSLFLFLFFFVLEVWWRKFVPRRGVMMKEAVLVKATVINNFIFFVVVLYPLRSNISVISLNYRNR